MCGSVGLPNATSSDMTVVLGLQMPDDEHKGRRKSKNYFLPDVDLNQSFSVELNQRLLKRWIIDISYACKVTLACGVIVAA
jgi:hypothetical protein